MVLHGFEVNSRLGGNKFKGGGEIVNCTGRGGKVRLPGDLINCIRRNKNYIFC